MDNPITTADLVARWRPLTTAETTVAAAFLDDAWEIVESKVNDIEAKLDDGRITLKNLRRVVCAAVLRVLKNPEGWREVALDDFRRVRDTVLSSGELYISDAELAGLEPTASTGAFTIRPAGLPDYLVTADMLYPGL